MAMGTVLGAIGTIAGAAALVWTWQVNEQVGALAEQAGGPDAVAAALAARLEEDTALADLLRGPVGPAGPEGAAADVDAVAASLAADHAAAIAGPAGPAGPAGADGASPSAAEVAAELLANAGDALVGPPGEAGPPGPAGVLPTGLVVAWQGETCPEGWSPVESARGRFILGSGRGPGGNVYAFGQTGGAESHNHGIEISVLEGARVTSDPAGTAAVAAAGPGSGVAGPALSMPPYVVFTFCTPAAE